MNEILLRLEAFHCRATPSSSLQAGGRYSTADNHFNAFEQRRLLPLLLCQTLPVPAGAQLTLPPIPGLITAGLLAMFSDINSPDRSGRCRTWRPGRNAQKTKSLRQKAERGRLSVDTAARPERIVMISPQLGHVVLFHFSAALG